MRTGPTGNSASVIVVWVVLLGVLAGFAARLVLKRHGIGLVKSLAIGAGGALLGWWVGRLLGGRHVATGIQVLWAAVGAVVVLVAVHMAASRRRPIGRRRLLWRGRLTRRRFRL